MCELVYVGVYVKSTTAKKLLRNIVSQHSEYLSKEIQNIKLWINYSQGNPTLGNYTSLNSLHVKGMQISLHGYLMSLSYTNP